MTCFKGNKILTVYLNEHIHILHIHVHIHILHIHVIILKGRGTYLRALDKRDYLVMIRDNFCEFSIKTYFVRVQRRVTTYGFDKK